MTLIYRMTHSAGFCLSSRCVWCQTTVHDDCIESLEDADRCDLGEFHSLIIPPHYLYRVNKLRRRHPDEFIKVLNGGVILLFICGLLELL